MSSISVCMITKNEGEHLRRCLESVKPLADEIVIGDSGSTDDTKEIAKEFGAKVFDISWEDHFANARNKVIEQASKDWIFVIDADEVLQSTQGVISLITKAPEKVGGFRIEQQSFLEKRLPGSVRNHAKNNEQYPFVMKKRLVRLFRNNPWFRFKHRVHELVEDSIRSSEFSIEPSQIVFDHYGNTTLSEEKQAYYESLLKKQLDDDPKSARYHYQIAKMLQSQGKLGEALKHYQKVADVNPTYKLIFSDIAKIHVLQKDIEKAIECYAKSLEQKPNVVATAYNLMVTYALAGKVDEAKKLLPSYLRDYPDHPALKHLEKQLKQNE